MTIGKLRIDVDVQVAWGRQLWLYKFGGDRRHRGVNRLHPKQRWLYGKRWTLRYR